LRRIWTNIKNVPDVLRWLTVMNRTLRENLSRVT
jgi:hypothetical protein